MGLCASCLGSNRHPSHKDENEGLLNSHPPSQYGTIGDLDAGNSQDEEEDVRQEREALEEISARAADDMIDILHGEHILGDPHPQSSNTFVAFNGQHADIPGTMGEQDADDAEQAWLQDLPTHELDQDVAAVKGSYAGNLVIDLSQLRDDGRNVARREL